MTEKRTTQDVWKQYKEYAVGKSASAKAIIWIFAVVAAWIGILIANAQIFNKWCDYAFNVSVDFLNYFNRWGGNYELNSVIICVVIPILVYIGLILMLIL